MSRYRLIAGFLVPRDLAPEGRLPAWGDEPAGPGGRLSEEPVANLSFKCPESSARMIALAARACGLGKSAFVRGAAVERAARVLSAMADAGELPEC